MVLQQKAVSVSMSWKESSGNVELRERSSAFLSAAFQSWIFLSAGLWHCARARAAVK